MKRKLLSLLFVLPLLAIFAACEFKGTEGTKEPSKDHVHTWDSGTVEKEATCSSEGSILYTCSGCSETKTESIPKTAHTEVIDQGTAPTCTETGLSEGSHCSVCNEVIVAQRTLPKTAHDLENNVCKDCGYETYTIGLQFELNDGGNDYTVIGYNGDEEEVIIPSKYEGKPVVAIKDSAFTECEFEKVTIAASVEEIGVAAFKDCENLESVNIPASVTIIKDETFSGCKALNSVTIEGDIKGIGEAAFYFCEELYSISLPESCVEIGAEAFRVCLSLSNITLSPKLTYLGAYSLSQTSITSIVIPSTLNTIEGGTFSQCRSLKNVTISEGVKTIEEYAFHSCAALEKIHIPASVTKIEQNIFAYTQVLRNLTVAEDNPVYDSRNNCKAIIETATNTLITGSGQAFIPNTVTSIAENAFFAIQNLCNVTIPTSVTSIGSSAFSMCTDLTSMIIPESITYIPSHMLSGCRSMIEIIIKGNVTVIGESAFSGTIYLRKLVLPASLTEIGEGAYTNMSTHKDTKIYFHGTGLQWSEIKNITLPEFENYRINGHIVFNYDGE